jgi:pimeloyl-ACP methyl ester carboxylesterase
MKRSIASQLTSVSSLLASVFTLVACGDDDTQPPADVEKPTYVLASCRVKALDTQPRERVCGTVDVEHARFAEADRRPGELAPIPLYVEHFPGESSEPPFVFLSGGPGVSIEAYASIGVVQKLLAAQSRGVVLVEQRGNALSPSGLACAEGAALASCREALVAEGVLPEAFNSRESAEDVAEVIAALGYERAVIWGHSYGSGLAQRVAQLHPERVATLVLEGVSAPNRRDPFDLFAHLVSTLDAFGAWHRSRCAADPSCSAVYPEGLDPAAEGAQVGELLQQNAGITIPLTPKLEFDQQTFAIWATNGLANYGGMLLFSELVHAIAVSSPEDRAPVDALVTRLGGGDLESGQAALEGFVAARLGAAAAQPSATVKTCFDLGGIGSVPECDGLDPATYSTEALAFSLSTDIPTLWLQGPLDTQTPIAQADPLRAQFSTLREALFAPCLGHFSYLDGEGCSDEVVAAFLASPEGPVPACVATVCETKPLTMRLVD